MKYLLAIIIFISANTFAQDSVKETVPEFQNVQKIFMSNRSYNFYGMPVSLIIETRKEQNNEGIFYYVLGLILYIALVRLIFYKYVSTLFTLFFRATLRQQQLREQLLQSPLPALLLNIFFVVSIATYFTFLGQYYKLPIADNFWTMLIYATIVVATVYTCKYILLNTAGWVFGIRNVAETYIFMVFLINKMIGIFLLPFIVLMAFPNPTLLSSVVMVSYILLACMLLYRFIITYRPVRSEIKLNRLHFFLYLCAFEIAPLLLIYKVLLAHVDRF
ncbi:MAG: DUF4271 domain-containing protein [Chitinophagaceae bacterium]|nr:DUF4271 domain-containing protein [Chitinophagaceae bacterium]